MQNVHPLFVHLPLALFPLAFIFQAVAFIGRRHEAQPFASMFLYLGALSAIPAAVTGWLAEEQVEELPGFTHAMHEVVETHATLMYVVLGLGLALALLAFWRRRRMTRALQAVLVVGLFVLMMVMGVGADRGGQLVFQYGVGGQRMGEPAASP
jgi:uncharacterized membrane protein